MKRKDALTDAVEALQGNQGQKPQNGPQQVVNEDGEVVTLGVKGRQKSSHSNKKKFSELSPEVRRSIERGIAAGIKEGFKDFEERIIVAIGKALREISEEIRRQKR